jgi:hypothetical protein
MHREGVDVKRGVKAHRRGAQLVSAIHVHVVGVSTDRRKVLSGRGASDSALPEADVRRFRTKFWGAAFGRGVLLLQQR